MINGNTNMLSFYPVYVIKIWKSSSINTLSSSSTNTCATILFPHQAKMAYCSDDRTEFLRSWFVNEARNTFYITVDDFQETINV